MILTIYQIIFKCLKGIYVFLKRLLFMDTKWLNIS